MSAQLLYPIIVYAHQIGKNTAELTVKDFSAFMKWWLKQPPRRDLMEGTAVQKATYHKDVAAMEQWRKEEKMGKNSKYTDAMTSRLPKQLDIEEEIEVVTEALENEVIAEMGLTQVDVDALLWALNEIFENYDLTGTIHDLSLKGLQEALEGI